MIQILELIKLLGLGIVSAILFINITMADIAKTKDFIKAVEEVRQEYPEDAVERKKAEASHRAAKIELKAKAPPPPPPPLPK